MSIKTQRISLYLLNTCRREWKAYFDRENIPFVFFSAQKAQELQEQEAQLSEQTEDGSGLAPIVEVDAEDDDILTTQQLVQHVVALVEGGRVKDDDRPVTIGFSGFPNVGKSSIINVSSGVTILNRLTILIDILVGIIGQ